MKVIQRLYFLINPYFNLNLVRRKNRNKRSNMKPLLLFLFAALFLAGCRSNVEDHEELTTEDVIPFNASQMDTHNSQNSLDWEGAYTGVLPCEVCEGKDTYLKLNEDQTFELTLRYLEASDEVGEERKIEGNFKWNEEGSAIILNGIEEEPRSFRVEEIYLTPLDSNGLEMRGEPGNNYKLLKL